MEHQSEDKIFKSLSTNIQINTRNLPEDSVIIRTLNTCHNLMVGRSELFVSQSNAEESNYGSTLFYDLLTANGACGSYAKVFARTLQNMGFTCRIAQMKSGNTWGVHIITEVKTKHGWAILDPLYNLYFTTPDNKLASFADVSKNWKYYQAQLPANYKMEYNYEDVRYTNWTKIPVVMPAVKSILDASIGKQAADHICIRTQFLSLYKTYSYFLSIVILCLSIYLVRKTLHYRHYKAVIQNRLKMAA